MRWANTLNTVCLALEGAARSFIAVVQRGHDQLMDILLIGWRWGNWESASSIPTNLTSKCLWAEYSYLLPPVMGFNIHETAQRYCYESPLKGNQDPTPRLHYCFLAVLPLSPIPSSIIINSLNLPVRIQGGWMRPISCNQEMRDIEKHVCPGAPLSESCSISLSVLEFPEFLPCLLFLPGLFFSH